MTFPTCSPHFSRHFPHTFPIYFAHIFPTLFPQDVRWCRGSISERIFAPLAERIRAGGGKIFGGRAVERVGVDARTNSITSLQARDTETGQTVDIADLDAVVFAVGVKGLQTLVLNNPEALGTRDEFSRTLNLKTIDCVSVRLHLRLCVCGVRVRARESMSRR